MQKPGIFIRMFDYDRKLIPNQYVSSKDENVTDIEEAMKKTGLTIGYPGWNFIYYVVLCSLDRNNSNVIVETGTNQGFSSIMISQALKDSKLDGHVFTVELDEENYKKAVNNIAEAGVQNLVTANRGDSKAYLKEFTSSLNSTIRIAFLDASHLQADALEEFELVYPHLNDESIVVFDNTYKLQDDKDNEQRVNGALRIIKERYGGNLINFPNCSWFTPGIAIWQKDSFSKDWT